MACLSQSDGGRFGDVTHVRTVHGYAARRLRTGARADGIQGGKIVLVEITRQGIVYSAPLARMTPSIGSLETKCGIVSALSAWCTLRYVVQRRPECGITGLQRVRTWLM